MLLAGVRTCCSYNPLYQFLRSPAFLQISSPPSRGSSKHLHEWKIHLPQRVELKIMNRICVFFLGNDRVESRVKTSWVWHGESFQLLVQGQCTSVPHFLAQVHWWVGLASLHLTLFGTASVLISLVSEWMHNQKNKLLFCSRLSRNEMLLDIFQQIMFLSCRQNLKVSPVGFLWREKNRVET